MRTRCVRAEEARHTIRALKNVLDVCEKSGSPFFQIFFLQYARARIVRDDYFRCKKSVYVVRKDYSILFAMPEEEIAQDTDCQAPFFLNRLFSMKIPSRTRHISL